MDGDRLLNVMGLLLVLGLVGGTATLVAVGMNSDSGETVEKPVANWNAERVNDTYVRITHAGGDPVDTDRLVVTVGGNERTVTWSETVFPGDAGLVQASPGTTVELYWQRDRATDRELLRSWQP